MRVPIARIRSESSKALAQSPSDCRSSPSPGVIGRTVIERKVRCALKRHRVGMPARSKKTAPTSSRAVLRPARRRPSNAKSDALLARIISHIRPRDRPAPGWACTVRCDRDLHPRSTATRSTSMSSGKAQYHRTRDAPMSLHETHVPTYLLRDPLRRVDPRPPHFPSEPEDEAECSIALERIAVAPPLGGTSPTNIIIGVEIFAAPRERRSTRWVAPGPRRDQDQIPGRPVSFSVRLRPCTAAPPLLAANDQLYYLVPGVVERVEHLRDSLSARGRKEGGRSRGARSASTTKLVRRFFAPSPLTAPTQPSPRNRWRGHPLGSRGGSFVRVRPHRWCRRISSLGGLKHSEKMDTFAMAVIVERPVADAVPVGRGRRGKKGTTARDIHPADLLGRCYPPPPRAPQAVPASPLSRRRSEKRFLSVCVYQVGRAVGRDRAATAWLQKRDSPSRTGATTR